MSQKILIVDDDKEFNTLLTDVFQQADYTVEACESVERAQEFLEANDFDLVVTDYRMPGRSGMDLIDSIHELAPETPVIMVSGYLENGVIRHLISRGVGGIFMKPLNIFSLLKKTSELIQKAEKQRSGEPVDGTREKRGGDSHMFRSFPGKDPRSREFARKLYDLRDFSKNLLLIGGSGAELATICEDLVALAERKDVPIFLSPERLEREALFDELEGIIEAGAEQITFVISETETLTPEQCELIYQVARRKGPFAALTLPKRFIFLLHRDLDYYYDLELIDEEFYIFLGSVEVAVPGLEEISEDIPLLADAMLEAAAPGKHFDAAARADLARRAWPGHMAELRKVVENAAKWSAGRVVKADDVRAVLEDRPATPRSEESRLALYLRARKRDYLQALDRLSPYIASGGGGDPSGVEPQSNV